jgi:hypothetical protein
MRLGPFPAMAKAPGLVMVLRKYSGPFLIGTRGLLHYFPGSFPLIIV